MLRGITFCNTFEPSNRNKTMQTLVETKSGEIVEIVNGVIRCQNTAKNWETVADWTIANESMVVLMTTNGKFLNIDLPGFSAQDIHSLLEHFDYQD